MFSISNFPRAGTEKSRNDGNIENVEKRGLEPWRRTSEDVPPGRFIFSPVVLHSLRFIFAQLGKDKEAIAQNVQTQLVYLCPVAGFRESGPED